MTRSPAAAALHSSQVGARPAEARAMVAAMNRTWSKKFLESKTSEDGILKLFWECLDLISILFFEKYSARKGGFALWIFPAICWPLG